MVLSDSGKDFIKAREGLSLSPYPDAGGYSVGYGHLIKANEQYLMAGVTLAKANELFIEDADAFAVFVDGKLAGVDVEQHEFDALVSFAYNVGKGAFASSTLLKKVRAGDKAGAACEFMKWIYSSRGNTKYVVPGLKTRRKAEQILYYGSEPTCSGLPKDTPSDIVKDDVPERKDAPVRGGGYAKNTLPPVITATMDKINEVLKETGKLPVKKGYKVQRQGDSNAGQGKITKTNQSTVYVNGKPVSVNGSLVIGPGPRHPTVTANGSKKVFAEGKRVNFETNPDKNQYPRVGGSDDTFTK